MNAFSIFAPHTSGCAGAFLWILVTYLLIQQRSWTLAFVSLGIYTLLYLLIVGLTPDKWLRAKATENQHANVAVLLNFGYEHNGSKMEPGAANLALLKYVLDNESRQLETMLMQEGVWVAVEEETLIKLGIERLRIHRHDPNIYVNTLDVAYCALQLLRKLRKNNILLVAHDLQLQRAAWDFEKVAQVIYPTCTIVVPDIRNTPYPAKSVQWHTRNSFFYKITELLIARPRDFISRIPNECIAPDI